MKNSFVLNYSQNDTHPLIPNQNSYYKQKKMIMVNSSDRNVIKYPDSATFEILLPTDIVNVATIQLKNWIFPTTHNAFSLNNNNLQFEFTLLPLTEEDQNSPINFNYDSPSSGQITGTNELDVGYIQLVNDCIMENGKFIVTLTEGTYESGGLALELQNRMNIAVNNRILEYSKLRKLDISSFYTPYVFFKIVTSDPQSKFWFVNTLNPFIFNNDSLLYKANNMVGETFLPCSTQRFYPSFTYYGLPAYLGFTDTERVSMICGDKYDLTLFTAPSNTELTTQPSFLQNYTLNNGAPNYINIHYIKPYNKWTLVKNTSIFLDMSTLNGVDSTRPFTNNEFTKVTNQGNGSVNAFLGRVSLIPTTINFAASCNGGDYQPTTNFNPPLERLTKFKVSIRYHDGSLVDFGFHEWMIALEVESFLPSQNVKLTQTPF